MTYNTVRRTEDKAGILMYQNLCKYFLYKYKIIYKIDRPANLEGCVFQLVQNLKIYFAVFANLHIIGNKMINSDQKLFLKDGVCSKNFR